MTAVVVLGSLFMDVAATAPRRPAPGETVIGTDLVIAPGGKGFNQAAAAAAAGAAAVLVSRVGDDVFGRDLQSACARAGVDARHVCVDPDEGTGVGLPVIDADGENAIVVVPRAASRLAANDAVEAAAAIEAADVLLLQLEVPLTATLAAARIAAAAGTPVLLNAAPADTVPSLLLELVDHLVVNEHEAAQLARDGEAVTPATAPAVAQHLVDLLGLASATVTLGADGAAWADRTRSGHVAGHAVTVVDTVGAGDAFCGYLAAHLAAGGDHAEAVVRANAAGALTVTAAGAQPAIPTAQAVDGLLRDATTTSLALEGNR